MSSTLLYLLFVLAAGVAVWQVLRRLSNPADKPRVKRPDSHPRSDTAANLAPHWQAADAIDAPTPLTDKQLHARMRDRYIEARFPGVAASSADLEQTERMIKGARHYFEEEKYDNAHELLEMAIEQTPAEPALRLAQIEIAFLRRGARLYTRLATEFNRVHPRSPAWSEVTRLGRSIAPEEAIFGADVAEGTHGRYGPWPQMPNWIHASWDLTSDVLAADLHRSLARGAALASHASTPSA
ncbi:MAG: hypothetical protein ABIQ72_02570 [Usitatibacter sp.]